MALHGAHDTPWEYQSADGIASRRAPLDFAPMGPRDHPRLLPDGADCTACGATIPADGISVLAERDDLVFVELGCAACGSTVLGLLTAIANDGEATLDLADEPTSGDGSRRLVDRPIREVDVAAARRSLSSWDGDLVGWLAELDRAAIDRSERS